MNSGHLVEEFRDLVVWLMHLMHPHLVQVIFFIMVAMKPPQWQRVIDPDHYDCVALGRDRDEEFWGLTVVGHRDCGGKTSQSCWTFFSLRVAPIFCEREEKVRLVISLILDANQLCPTSSKLHKLNSNAPNLVIQSLVSSESSWERIGVFG